MREIEYCLRRDHRAATDIQLINGGLVGVPGIEPGTSSLSGTRSNQLSYTPNGIANF